MLKFCENATVPFPVDENLVDEVADIRNNLVKTIRKGLFEG